MTKETKALFTILGKIEQIRDLLRLTAPNHKFDHHQKVLFENYLSDIKVQLTIIEEIKNGSKN